ncbi:hypothetical protein Ping_3321 [Psychromonas ingrahamii 37]|uniref:HEAT repeat domain-containing protein n=1 Tax=Psychromonas ingrahamii (strain DSM 17664 / CCUG 51855 / 37) TaxID=357804 RepID=A1SZU3_PSYIN|nr:HEAT repeat domain-containing protein [Psychromonas ingrahamii]ABM05008.1 hypothetical protein Ping_3321 [Psychromonas ingrahamii 37]
MKKRDQRGDTPSLDINDQLKVKEIAHPFRFEKYSKENELTELIVEAVNRMGGSGELAEEKYRLCVDKLCRKSKLTSQIIQEEYFDLAEDAYLDRWGLTMLAVELQDQNGLAFFDKILAEEIPEEKSKDPHSFTSVGEEVMIRTTAIEGLERLAANGNDDAIKVLFGNISHEVFSVRRAATQALLAVGGENMLEKLKSELPKRHHDLLKIKRTDVRNAEQAEGGLFIRNQDDSDIPAPKSDSSAKHCRD